MPQRTLQNLSVLPARFLIAFLLLALPSTRPAIADDSSTVSVLLKDATGTPVSGALITLETPTQSYTAQSAPNGTATFKGDTTTIRRVDLHARKPGWVTMSLRWRQSELPRPAPFEIQMEKSTTLGGTVVDQDNKPLANAAVALRINTNFSIRTQYMDNSTYITRTDQAGKWQIQEFPAMFGLVFVGAIHQDCLPASGDFKLTPTADIPGLRAGTFTLTLTRGTPLAVEVHNPDGTPAAGAILFYGPTRAQVAPMPEITLGPDGKTTLGIQPGTKAIITIRSAAYAPELVEQQITDTPDHVLVTLAAPHMLTGSVVSPSGAAIPGASIRMNIWRGSRTLADTTLTTDSSGNFFWPQAPADEITAIVYATGFRSAPKTLKAGQDNTITLSPPPTFQGTVLDAATSTPIRTFRAQRGYRPVLPPGAVSSRPENFIREADTITRPDLFHFPPSADGTFTSDLSSTSTVFRIMAEGYFPMVSPPFSLNDGDAAYTFKLEKGDPVEGILLDPQNHPVPHAVIHLATAEVPLTIRDGQVDSFDSVAVTNDAGNFIFPPQKNPYLLVTLTDTGFSRAFKDDFEKDHKLVFQKWARVEGIVLDGANPVPDARGDMQYDGFNSIGSSSGPNRPLLSVADSFQTDAAGKFTIPHVVPCILLAALRKESATENGISYTHIRYTPLTPARPGETVQLQLGN